jgi:hypothetical protein
MILSKTGWHGGEGSRCARAQWDTRSDRTPVHPTGITQLSSLIFAKPISETAMIETTSVNARIKDLTHRLDEVRRYL